MVGALWHTQQPVSKRYQWYLKNLNARLQSSSLAIENPQMIPQHRSKSHFNLCDSIGTYLTHTDPFKWECTIPKKTYVNMLHAQSNERHRLPWRALKVLSRFLGQLGCLTGHAGPKMPCQPIKLDWSKPKLSLGSFRCRLTHLTKNDQKNASSISTWGHTTGIQASMVMGNKPQRKMASPKSI